MTIKFKHLVLCLLVLQSTILYSAAQSSVIIPQPNSVTFTGGNLQLKQNVSIYEQQCAEVFDYVEGTLVSDFGAFVEKSSSANGADVVFVNRGTNAKSEAYKLTISPNGMLIEADSERGVFYGVQSLFQIVRASLSAGGAVPCQVIDDAPRFAWRSFMLDESRYFKGAKEVYRILDAMAELKMNIFHWHLTDDQGWRVESKKYPLLTEIGSKRKDTQIGGWNSKERSGVPHSGFYTQEEIRLIVKYAQERQISIVPEIEMPGHATAAVASYPWLGSSGKTPEVAVEFGKLYDVFNVTDEKVMGFLQDIVSEMFELFDCDVIHIGGDEVRFDQWEQNPKIAAYKESKKFTSFMDIQIEATNKMSQFISAKGKQMMGWNEILGTNLHADDNISFSDPSQKIASNVIVHFWKGQLSEMAQAAKDGYQLVNSYHIFTYLDYSHETIPLEKAYNFDPIPEGLEQQYHKNIIGSGAQMWSEWIPTVSQMHRQIFPRIAAYAEVGWTEPKNKDFESFLYRLPLVVEGWKKMGIKPYEE